MFFRKSEKRLSLLQIKACSTEKFYILSANLSVLIFVRMLVQPYANGSEFFNSSSSFKMPCFISRTSTPRFDKTFIATEFGV